MPPPHAIQKHSVLIAGHRTSLTLEAAFWDQLQRIAAARGLSLNKLVEEIDRARAGDPAPANLSSAIRVFVLQQLVARPPA
jgi:predicted DNA-binding ribbon-helix-helix protein